MHLPESRAGERSRRARALLWMSPDELLLLCPHGEAAETAARLREALAPEHALVVDVSDARALIDGRGAGAARRPGQARAGRPASVTGSRSAASAAPGSARRRGVLADQPRPAPGDLLSLRGAVRLRAARGLGAGTVRSASTPRRDRAARARGNLPRNRGTSLGCLQPPEVRRGWAASDDRGSVRGDRASGQARRLGPRRDVLARHAQRGRRHDRSRATWRSSGRWSTGASCARSAPRTTLRRRGTTLAAAGVSDLFVFPHIDWTPKGQAIAR